MSKQALATEKRRLPRTQLEPTTPVFIGKAQASGKFTPSRAALLLDESLNGCSIVLTSAEELTVGETIQIKVGSLSPVQTEVRWIEKMASNVFRVGLMYLDYLVNEISLSE